MIAWLQSLHRFGLETLSTTSLRIATWLILGNAGALVIAFNAIVGGSSCEPHALAPIIWSFSAGLFVAFFAVAASYVFGLIAMNMVGNALTGLITIEMHEFSLYELRTEHPTLPENNAVSQAIDEQLRKLSTFSKETRWFSYASAAIIVLTLASAFFFARGVMLPILSGGTLLESCATP